MAGSDNRVTVVIDAENDTKGAFAAATAEAEAFKKAIDDANRASFSGSRASVEGYNSQLRALRALRGAIDEVRKGQQLLDDQNRGNLSRANESIWRQLLKGNGGDQGGGGFFRGLLGGIAGLGGKGILGSVLGPLLGGIGGGLIIPPLVAGLTSIIANLAAAALGVGSLGALAIPTFTKIAAAVTGGRKAMEGLSPAEKTIAIDTKSLFTGFGEMAAKMTPALTKMGVTLLDIANKVMPLMLPLAKQAGTAIEGILKSIDKMVSSPGFASFMKTMIKESGPAISTLLRDAVKLAPAIGHLLQVAGSPNGLRILNAVTDILVTSINFLAWAINTVGGNMKKWGDIAHQTASKFDEFRNDTAHYFDDVRHSIAAAGDFIAHFFMSDILNWVNDGVRWFQQLPAKIITALASLPGMLFRAGQHAVQSLINGLGSMLGSLGSMASSLASKVAGFFGLSPAKEGPLSGMGAPEVRGRHFAEAFATGMLSGRGGVGAAAAALAGGAGPGGTFGAAGGGLHVQLEVTGAGSDALVTWIRQMVRLKGGGNVQRAFGGRSA